MHHPSDGLRVLLGLGMKVLLQSLTLAMLLSISGCASFDQSYDTTPGVVDRAMQKNLWLGGVDTGKAVAGGLSVNDALVVTYGADLAKIYDLRIAQFNGASVGAALTQAAMAAAIGGIALGQGSLASAGGVAAFSLFLQHVFGIANTPAKANAYLGGKNLLAAAENEYWLALAAESCGPTVVSGTELTTAGAQYLVRINNSATIVQNQLQMTMPTLEQMKAATVPAGNVGLRMRALETPCAPDPATKKLKRQSSPRKE